MSLFSIRLILNQGASSGVTKRLCIVMDRDLISFCMTRCMTSLKVTGLWTYLLFYMIFWWCSQGLSQGEHQYRGFYGFTFLTAPKNTYFKLFQVSLLTTLKHGLHSARSLHDFAWTFSDWTSVRSFCSVVPSTRAAFVIGVERWWRCLPCPTHHCSLWSQSHGGAVPDNGRVHREEPCFFFLVCILQHPHLRVLPIIRTSCQRYQECESQIESEVNAIAGLAGIHLPDFPCGLWSSHISHRLMKTLVSYHENMIF